MQQLHLRGNTNTLPPQRERKMFSKQSYDMSTSRKPLESTGEAKGLPATNLLNHLHGQTPSPHLPKGSMTIVWKQTSQKRRGAPRRGRRPGWPKEELKVENRSTKDVVVFYVTNEKLKGKRS
uniref:Uncharacterized protein n=1 Tax=Oryza meridionalis TaxID=40149 RepID=A0A0E0D2D7_9ORYZ